MKKVKLIILIVILCATTILVFYKLTKPSPCFSQEFVENYISKYSKDFTFLKNETYSLGINGFKESDETDWYFHDNELDFDFHVKTLKSEYPPKGKHIACNYYDDYVEKLINVKGQDIKQIVTDTFDEIYDIDNYNIYFYHSTGQIRIEIGGKTSENFTNEKYAELCQITSKKIFENIEKYDFNFKNRSMKIGWDVDLNTDWSNTHKYLSIMINGKIFSVNDYYKYK